MSFKGLHRKILEKKTTTLTVFRIILKYHIQHMPRPPIDISVRLPIIRRPEFIPLREPLLEAVLWECSTYIRARPPLVAGMNAIMFAHVLYAYPVVHEHA